MMTYSAFMGTSSRLFRRKDSFHRPLLRENNRLRRTDFRGEDDLFVGVPLRVEHDGNELLVELKNLRRRLNAFAVAFAFFPLHGNLHGVLLPQSFIYLSHPRRFGQPADRAEPLGGGDSPLLLPYPTAL